MMILTVKGSCNLIHLINLKNISLKYYYYYYLNFVHIIINPSCLFVFQITCKNMRCCGLKLTSVIRVESGMTKYFGKFSHSN